MTRERGRGPVGTLGRPPRVGVEGVWAMKAAVYYETGDPEVFRYEDVADPAMAGHELLVRVEAISIEGGDTLNRTGGDLSGVPHIVGYQCAGTVVATGDQVTRYKEGDRVVTVGLDGSHAELRSV